MKPTTPNLLAVYAVASPKTRCPSVEETVTTRGFSLRAQVRHRRADGGRGAEQVDHDDAVPVGAVELLERRREVHAGGGDDGVEGAAGAVDEPRDGGLGGAGVGEVDDLVRDAVDGHAVEGEGTAAGLADGGDGGGAEAAGGTGHEDGSEGGGARHGRLLPG